MPRRVDHEERRGQLTAALLRIAGSRGLQAVTMRQCGKGADHIFFFHISMLIKM